MVQALEGGIDSIRRESVTALLTDKELVRCIWETIVSRGIQYRMQIAFIRGRQSFIQKGVSEDLMPLTEELAVRVADEKIRRT